MVDVKPDHKKTLDAIKASALKIIKKYPTMPYNDMLSDIMFDTFMDGCEYGIERSQATIEGILSK